MLKTEFITKKMENKKGIFQSSARFSSGSEDWGVGLSLFTSLSHGELNTKTSELLHQQEIKTGNSHAFDVRRKSFLHGRIAAKMAVNQIFPHISPSDLQIETGCFGKPHIKNLAEPYGISIAHEDLWNAGLCFPLSFPMGIDVEKILEKNRAIIPSIFSGGEKEICNREEDSLEFSHILWTAKEAVGKAIGLGFRVPEAWFEIDFVETIQTDLCLIRQCRFKQLSLFSTVSAAIPQGILTIAFPAENNLEGIMASLLEDVISKFQCYPARAAFPVNCAVSEGTKQG